MKNLLELGGITLYIIRKKMRIVDNAKVKGVYKN